MIPIDSRYCSYCAVDLRHSTDPFQLGGDAEAETAVLNGHHWNHPTGDGGRGRTQGQIGGHRSQRRLRHPLLLIAAIFAISFIIMKMILQSATAPAAPAGDESGSAAPRGATVPGGDIGDVRLAALRHALDGAGYRSVRFRFNGDILQVWGTVPEEFDRGIVQVLVLQTVGVVPLQDNLQVHNEYAEPEP
jgi:hypothetical protein